MGATAGPLEETPQPGGLNPQVVSADMKTTRVCARTVSEVVITTTTNLKHHGTYLLCLAVVTTTTSYSR